MICRRVVYRGRVQGVGFRYTAQHVAAGFAVAGYVRNLSDGSVELEALGEGDQVQAFLDALAQRMAGNIARADVEDVAPGAYQGFKIRH
jgi:acylphosphatase